jgi:hypothetical protein
MKHFKFLAIISVFFLLMSCGPSGVEIRGQFYTSGADVPAVGERDMKMNYLMFRKGKGKMNYLKPINRQHADDMVKVENGMCHCNEWYYTTPFVLD